MHFKKHIRNATTNIRWCAVTVAIVVIEEANCHHCKINKQKLVSYMGNTTAALHSIDFNFEKLILVCCN